jgi:hypothetical protein
MNRRLALAALLSLASCTKTETSTEIVTVPAPDETAPLVLAASPSDGSPSVPLNARVSAAFSETMDATSLTASTLTLTGPGGAVVGTVAVSGDARVATFTPAAPLAPGATYTAQVTTGALDAAGNPLGAAVAWTFGTSAAPDVAAPTVDAVSPVAGALAAASETPAVSVIFSEPIDCTALPADAIALYEDGLPVAGYLDCAGATLSLVPVAALPTQTSLFAVVSPLVTDLAGNALGAARTWSFEVRPWTRQLGTTYSETVYGVATDSAGDVYVAGSTAGAMDGLSAGGSDLFLAKYAPNGASLWMRQLGTPGEETVRAIASDADGNVYLAGYTNDGLDGNVSAGGNDLFVVKYDAAGAKQWTRQLGTAGEDLAFGISIDAAGNAFVTGSTAGGLDGNPFAGGIDLFVVKYDAGGVRQWTRQLGTAQYDEPHGIAIDGRGNLFVAGRTGGALDGNVAAGADDLFVVKYSSSGVKQWTRQLGGAGNDSGWAVATDWAGNVYVAGITDGSFDGHPSAGNYDYVVVKYDGLGAKAWSRQQGAASTDRAFAIATDAAGDVFVAGDTYTGASYDVFVSKLDASGAELWQRQLESASSDFCMAVTIDPAGSVFAAGYTSGDLDGNASIGVTDAFVVKYGANGRKR